MAEEFPAMLAMKQNRGPSSAAWVTEACAIRDQLNFFHRQFLIPSGPAGRLQNILKHFYNFMVYLLPVSLHNREQGESHNMATKKAVKKAAPKKAMKKAMKKK
jgi:hypothetical protein